MPTEKSKTILLVEDEAILAMTGKMTLEKNGYAVLIAGSGEEALDVFWKNPEINLVLMDIDLGEGMDGTECAALILGKRDVPSYTFRAIPNRTLWKKPKKSLHTAM